MDFWRLYVFLLIHVSRFSIDQQRVAVTRFLTLVLILVFEQKPNNILARQTVLWRRPLIRSGSGTVCVTMQIQGSTDNLTEAWQHTESFPACWCRLLQHLVDVWWACVSYVIHQCKSLNYKLMIWWKCTNICMCAYICSFIVVGYLF